MRFYFYRGSWFAYFEGQWYSTRGARPSQVARGAPLGPPCEAPPGFGAPVLEHPVTEDLVMLTASVAQAYGVPMEALRAPHTNKTLGEARALLCYLWVDRLGGSTAEVAHLIRRHYSTTRRHYVSRGRTLAQSTARAHFARVARSLGKQFGLDNGFPVDD